TFRGADSLGSHATINVEAGSLNLSSTTAITGSRNSLTLTGAGNGTLAGALATDGGSLTKEGTGTWNLTGKSVFTGGTTVNNGTLALGSGGSQGTLRGGITVNNGGAVATTAVDAIGFGVGVQVSTITLNSGGLFDNLTGG